MFLALCWHKVFSELIINSILLEVDFCVVLMMHFLMFVRILLYLQWVILAIVGLYDDQIMSTDYQAETI